MLLGVATTRSMCIKANGMPDITWSARGKAESDWLRHG